MRKANVFVNGLLAGQLQEIEPGKQYRFTYEEDYTGPHVSLTMQTTQSVYTFDRFPPFFKGKYSEKGLKMLSSHLKQLKDFPLTAKEQVQLACQLATKLSIQGVHPK